MNTAVYADTTNVGSVDLIDHMGDELKVANAARMCREKYEEHFNDKSERLIKDLLTRGHMSVFEHCVMTFIVECPIFTRTHLFRYRTASPTEVSGRLHSKISNSFWCPNAFRGNTDPELVKLFKETATKAVETYEKLVSEGVPPEQARGILPQGAITRFTWTIDLRNFIHVWQERSASACQAETRAIVLEMARQARKLFPTIGEYYNWPIREV